MAQFVALLASIATVALPGVSVKKGGKSNNHEGNTGVGSIELTSNFNFSLGIVTGMFIMAQMRRYRIRERLRAYCFTLLLSGNEDAVNDDGDNEARSETNGKTSSSPSRFSMAFPSAFQSQVEGTRNEFKTWGESSIVETLVSASNSLTSNLHCDKITIKPGTGTAPRDSAAVELYYILDGVCHFEQFGDGRVSNGNDDCSTTMHVHDYVIVQPWKPRTLHNKSTNDVVFLRISDSTHEYNGDFDSIIPEGRVDRMAMLTEAAWGLKTSFSRFGDFVRRTSL